MKRQAPALEAALAQLEAAQLRRASHLITGHGAEHARLEEELAAFTRRERVLLDRLCHASLVDGARSAEV
jgi:7-keto-8-aminopelargonate synthetase-like enzyme